LTVIAIHDALQKALHLHDVLVSQRLTMTALAKQEKVTQRYIAHLIKLAFLAPDIIDAINKGDIPPALTLERLKRTIPLDWEDQRQTFGFVRQAATPN